MEPESIFLSYVRYTFKRWAGFQQAIIEGMGGDYTDEKEIWLGNEVENYFKRYDKVHPDEIEDYLGSMIENEFDTYFEDGSLQQVSKNFCIAYPLSLTNPDAEIFQDMRNKPVIKLSANVKSSQDTSELTEQELNKQDALESTDQELNEQAVCENLEQLTVSENKDDDGWTMVKRKNKNK
ncbi:unnamed protein product [Larinioides sclopetarius]|uniref:Pre-rRNA-processing protein TSR2 homolog n=1 Tax=Larinioides sclopetarius TaxID=280406 RepID=A0AAV1ZPH7_9ARAC